ncbi:Dipeptidyl-peptidase 5 [Diatrype stigma]|uniref:Dipeptidyl-peptidase V n=1 Tax=Diatrype stigma TaxID=117547 RepID=A0AAN9V7P0_9PEZI
MFSVVIAPNPTASGGWGQNLTDAIQGNWGSLPYWDLVKAWEYVDETLDYVDTSRGIEAGASFGGYMTNWIQGHELGRRFKALVTHDGSTSTLNQYASEELWFMNHDFSGPFNETAFKPGSPYYDYNPLLYVDNWATPHFVVHSSLDYRLPISEGILLFNLLQTRGVPSKLLNFPDENHWVINPENSLVWHTEIFKWINYYSGISNATSPY